MNLFFASMHGAAAEEVAILCRGAGVNMFVSPANGIIDTLTKIHEKKGLEPLGVKFLSHFELESMLSTKSIDLILATTPDQIEQYNSQIRARWGVPLAVRHGVNSFDAFRKLGLKNFMTPSLRAADEAALRNTFISRKLVPWDRVPQPESDTEMRGGFFSYIHNYEKCWPGHKSKFDWIRAAVAPIPMRNYGNGSPHGQTNDLAAMRGSRGTIHIKGGQVCCNAVIRSMSVGTPVIMDEATYRDCYFDQVDGICVMKGTQDIISLVKALDQNDDAFVGASALARASAERQFSYDDDLGARFLKFISACEV